jgi:hypothetical protein
MVLIYTSSLVANFHLSQKGRDIKGELIVDFTVLR